MIAYHGSSVKFDYFDLSKCKDNMNESIGIYFSTDKKIAQSYGNYIYKLEINDFLDFRKESICRKFIYDMLESASIDTTLFHHYAENIIHGIYTGNTCIYDLNRKIHVCLDNDMHLYFEYEDRLDEIYDALTDYIEKHLRVYMFHYSIENIGVAKTINPAYIRIIDVEKQN